MTTDNFCFYLKNRLIQTSQTGGQQYSDTSPFSIPWFGYVFVWVCVCLGVCMFGCVCVCLCVCGVCVWVCELNVSAGTWLGVCVFGCVCVCEMVYVCVCELNVSAGNTKGGSITVPLTSCLTGLESAV